jgi:hypothetical protein
MKKSRQGGFKNINIFKKIRRGAGVHPTKKVKEQQQLTTNNYPANN